MAQAGHRNTPKRKRVRFNISVPPELADALHKWIKEGRYDGPSEFMRIKIRQELGLNRTPSGGS